MTKIKTREFDKDNLFFTADTHFFHTNIIKYTDRPFSHAGEMNDELVKRWNEIIPDDGVVFHLGDFSLNARPKALDTLVHKLNGEIYLVIGNHERDALKKEYIRNRFSGLYDIAEIFVKDDEVKNKEQHILMCHNPMLSWNGSHRGSWQLFGHHHGDKGNKIAPRYIPAQMDVGVDTNNYYPYTYQQVKEQITKQILKNK